jgi:DNA-binding NarL/FixJ family response regulator
VPSGGEVTPIGVIHGDALVRRGLAIGLRAAGFEAEESPDLIEWANRKGNRLAINVLHPDAALDGVKDACAHNADLKVVLVTEGPSVTFTIQALKAGAAAVVSSGESFDGLIDIVGAAMRGETVMPTHLAREICRRTQLDLACAVSKREAGWIRDLAGGRTVRMLAERAGYSEREMYRLLHRTYQSLGARNRTEALVRAASSGLLDQEL